MMDTQCENDDFEGRQSRKKMFLTLQAQRLLRERHIAVKTFSRTLQRHGNMGVECCKLRLQFVYQV